MKIKMKMKMKIKVKMRTNRINQRDKKIAMFRSHHTEALHSRYNGHKTGPKNSQMQLIVFFTAKNQFL